MTAKGETKASVRFGSGLQADLRVVPEDQFVYALHHFTGSKDHNVQMRQRALARGLSLSEWGLVPAAGEETVKEKVAAAEPRRRVRQSSEARGAVRRAGPALNPAGTPRGAGRNRGGGARRAAAVGRDRATCEGAFTITPRPRTATTR